MFSKWIIKDFPDYVFGEDKKLYRLPQFKNKKYFELREIKKQDKNRYRMQSNGVYKWVSINKLKQLVYIDKNPIKLYEIEQNPFN
jgi:hypothetical protein